MLQKVTSWGN